MDRYTAHKRFLIARCEQRGYSVEEVMPCVIEKLENDIWVIDVNHPTYPAKKREFVPRPVEDLGEGVGTELKSLLSMFNIQASPNCSCLKRAKIMNENGVDWCENNQDIILDWLKEEALKRKLPFFRYAAKKMLHLAISRTKHKVN